jgi:3',5'-cyclic AMP phosphodiesterase CpdA
VDEAPSHSLIQITDIHVGAVGGSARHPVDTTGLLELALDQVEAAGIRPAALLLTGDLTDDGTVEQYRRLRAVLAPVLARTGVPLVALMGNHDDRAALREHLLGEPASTGPLDSVHWFDGLRVIALDSTVPGRAHGELRPDQLAWLRDQLAEPAPHGTLLALHHPPLPSPVALARAIALRNPAALATALAGGDVRMVLAGHVHTAAAGTLAGVPVWTGGPIAATIDGLLGDELRWLTSPGVTRVDVFAECVLAGHVPVAVPIDRPVIDHVPAERLAPKLAELRALRDAPEP